MQRRALALLFAVLTGAFAAVAGDALQHPHGARRLVVGIAAAVVAVWLATLSLGVVRRRSR